jgi:dTMP kinase
MKKKSLFITFEGVEGSGKSTHIKKIRSFLTKKGLKVKVFYEPGSTPLGEKIRKILLAPQSYIVPKAELFLYLAARAQFTQERLIPALQEFDVVISDRFTDSTLVYQGAGLKLGVNNIQPLVDFSCQSITPDLTFVLDLNPEIGLSRIKRSKDRIEKRTLSFHRILRKGYRQLAADNPGRIKLIKTGKINDTYNTILNQIKKYV